VDSPHCGWEIRKAKELRKRLPADLSDIQYVPFTAPHDFDQALARLVRALSKLPAWERLHAGLLEQAHRFNGL
jgi:hypothetical protein